MALTRKAVPLGGRAPDAGALLRGVLAQTLQKSPSFKDIPHTALAALEREFQIRRYAPREIVFLESQTEDAVLLMLRGVATLTYLDARHRRMLFGVIGPGEVCVHAEAAPEALRGRLRCDTVRDCVIATLDYKRLVELLLGVPFGRFTAGIEFIFGHRDDRLAQAVLARGKTLRQRLLEVLSDLCARFGVPNDNGTVLDLPLTHDDLADLVGASRPRVTREIRLLEKAGILSREGRMLVLKLGRIL